MKQLNNRQKMVIWIGVAVVIAMILFPPWQISMGNATVRMSWVTYTFLFWPPRMDYARISMAVGQLCMQLAGVGIVVAAVVVLLKQNGPGRE